MFFNKNKKSSSNWEDSFYGGYRKVVYDYPYIPVPEKLSIVQSEYDYVVKKVGMILLEKCNKNKNTMCLLSDLIKLEDGKHQISRTALSSAITYLELKNDELLNLFNYYKKDILELKFILDLKDSEGSKTGSLSKLAEGESEKTSSEKKCALQKEALSIFDEISSYEVKSFKASDDNFDARHDEIKSATTFKLMKLKARDTSYSREEQLMASRLVRLLDINFDPKDDIIESLRSGTLDQSKIATILAGNSHVYYRKEKDISTRPFSIMILMDESGSMNGYRDTAQLVITKMLYLAFSEIMPQNRMYIYGHSSTGKRTEPPEIRVYHEPGFENFERSIGFQKDNQWRENYDGPVYDLIYERIRKNDDSDILAISISDGAPAGCNYGGSSAIENFKKVIEKCKRDRFVTVGIGIDYFNYDIYNYRKVVNTGDIETCVKDVSSIINLAVKTEFQ